jgi:hypothetical protein
LVLEISTDIGGAMKKIVLLVLVVSLFGAVNVAAEGPLGLTGFGVYGTMGSTSGQLGGGVGLSLKWGSFPVVGLQYNLSSERLNAAFDYYVVDAQGLAENLSYFVGGGLYAGVATAGEDIAFDFGLRIPVGLQFWPVQKLELFIAPVLAIPLLPAPGVDFGAEFGARIRF